MNDLMRQWLKALIAGLDGETDREVRKHLMRRCGEACAEYHGSVKRVRSLRKRAADTEELLKLMNGEKDFWCGDWKRDGDVYYSICVECGCPLVAAGVAAPSPTFCECSAGWVRAVFAEILAGPVTVELSQAIGRGDAFCKYTVRAVE